ncbi:transient receptor potential cation channel subfamily V member 6-like [Spea bombifrons]|uniref:transient receptor potential cation channel subfamily V member 6-like n=1 Tax=Spea bombifrons TaxID=233779 RepID=UPI0023491D37|nr:transient receptor potential cation channel subfamily V member 6-like [Spea bombifrons]
MFAQVIHGLNSWIGQGQSLEDETTELVRHRRVQELPLLLAAKENNVVLLRELLEDETCDKLQRGAVGETALHVAVQHNHLEAAKILIERAPDLVNQPMTSDLYQGQTALHIASVNQNINLVRLLIDGNADVSSPRATGTFFALRSTNIFYFGEHILTFAACVGNTDIAELLMDNGADPRAQDSWGNTVLHILVLQPNKVLSCQMLDFLLSREVRLTGPSLCQIPNAEGLTPLKMAAIEGNVTMFQHLVQKKGKLQRAFGPVTSMFYDLSEIDSVEKEKSLLELIVSSNKSQARKILNFPPVKSLLKKKWRHRGRPCFWILTAAYVLYMICVSLCCANRPLKPREDNTTSSRDITQYVKKSLQESYVTSEDLLRLCGEIISVIGAILFIVIEIVQMWKAGLRCFVTYKIWEEPFHVIRFSFSILILVTLILRLTNTDGEVVPMSMALVLGWCYVMYFARGFQMLGPFTIIIQKMAASDLLKFVWLMAVVVFGYSTALYIVFQTVNPEALGAFSPYPISLISTYQLFLNVLNGPDNYDVDLPDMYSFLYASFCVIAFLLMFNLLIAMMGDTQAAMTKKKEELWMAQITSATVTMEQKFPRGLMFGSRSIEEELEGKQYLSVEERKWHPLPSMDGSDSSEESDDDVTDLPKEKGTDNNNCNTISDDRRIPAVIIQDGNSENPINDTTTEEEIFHL